MVEVSIVAIRLVVSDHRRLLRTTKRWVTIAEDQRLIAPNCLGHDAAWQAVNKPAEILLIEVRPGLRSRMH